MVQLLNWIKQLEGKSDIERNRITKRLISKQKIPYTTEQFPEGTNIIVTKPGKLNKEILAVCHTDAFPGSPGANDNASAVAVLIDALRKLKTYKSKHTIKFIFFDKEEVTLIGSSAYVKRHGLEDILSVLDLELVGRGDIIGIWPITKEISKTKIVKSVKKICKEQRMPFIEGRNIKQFFGDYLPFRQGGLSESICLTFSPKEEARKVLRFAKKSPFGIMLHTIFSRLTQKEAIPEFFKHYHSKEDTSNYLREADLQKMSKLVQKIIIDLDNQLP